MHADEHGFLRESAKIYRHQALAEVILNGVRGVKNPRLAGRGFFLEDSSE